MKKRLALASRFCLGAIFTVFGLNGFFQFMPMPPPPPEAGAFLGGLMAAGYFFPLLKGVEVIAGLLLLSGCFVPLALVLLAPIVVNIFCFHLFLEPGGLVLAIPIVALEIALAYFYKRSFAGVLAAKAEVSK